MPVLQPVVATLLANTEQFTASLGAAKVEMDTFATESMAAGDAAGAGLGGGVKKGAEGVTGELATVGADAGSAFSGGITKGAEDAEKGLGKAGKAAKDAGNLAKDSGGKFSILGSLLGNLPGPLGQVKGKTDEYVKSLDKVGSSGSGMLSVIGSIPNPYLVAGAAVAATTAIAIDFGEKYQSTTDKIAASANISVAQAGKISDAFFKTAGTTTYTSQQISDSFSKVAGQAKTLNGGTLTAKDGLDLMKASMDAAEATGGSLDGTTKSITKTLQTFGLKTKDSAQVADVLVSAGNATGQSVSALGGSLDKVKGKLGGMAPPMGELAGLLVDMTAHGVNGRMAMGALSGTFTQFLKPITAQVKAQKDLKDATGNLPPQLKALAAEYVATDMKSGDVSKATQGLTIHQAALWGKFKSSADASKMAGLAYQKLGFDAIDAHGKLRPMGEIIGKLHDSIKGMGTAQAQGQLAAEGFGGASAKLVAVIKDGPKAYERYRKQVEEKGAAEKAAVKATAGLHASMEKVKSTVLDAATALGVKLMPTVTLVAQDMAKAAGWITAHWSQISIVFKVAFDSIKNIFEGIMGVVKGFIEVISGVIDFIKGVFTGNWSEAWKGVQKVFEGIWEAIKGVLQALFGQILGMLEGFGVNIFRSFDKAWSAVINFFKRIPGQLVSALNAFGGMILNWITSAWNTMVGWVEGALATYINFWIQLPSRIIQAVQSLGGLLTGWISGAFSKLVDGVSNGISWVVSWFSQLPGKIFNIIGDTFQWLRDAGWNLMMGLLHGIENGAGWVVDKLKEVGKSIINTFTGMFNIFSPSRVFHGYGENLMRGLANGISDNSHLAQDAIKGVGKGLSTNFSIGGISGVGGVSAIAPQGVGGNQAPTILNVTSPIQISGQTIAQVVTKYQLQSARATGTVLGQYSGGSQTGAATGFNVNAISR